MNDRQNTIVCSFDPASLRVTARQIHDWIYERLQLPETEVRMIQIERVKVICLNPLTPGSYITSCR
jgi:hypothetical protein